MGRRFRLLVGAFGALFATAVAAAPPFSVAARFTPPPGFTRVPVASGSFGEWLRALPLKPADAQVHLYDGSLKADQDAHVAVIDLDVGTRDLQQCADAVIRLRAEWLWSAGRFGEIAFHFTSGDLARWSSWSAGLRPRVTGSRVEWVASQAPSSSRATFRAYLDCVFTYAGSASLERELRPVPALRVEPGDVFVHGGTPGHAVIVVDVASDAAGNRAFLLAQSYMPAQEIEVLRNPDAISPWYIARDEGQLVTPEWVFGWEECRAWGR